MSSFADWFREPSLQSTKSEPIVILGKPMTMEAVEAMIEDLDKIAGSVPQVITSRADMKLGAIVWEFDPERTRYVDGKYAGRGDYRPCPITDETKTSWIVSGMKFNKKTGVQLGNRFGNPSRIFSDDEKIAREWSDKHIHRLADAVRSYKGSLETLKQIAELVGYEDD